MRPRGRAATAPSSAFTKATTIVVIGRQQKLRQQGQMQRLKILAATLCDRCRRGLLLLTQLDIQSALYNSGVLLQVVGGVAWAWRGRG